MAIEVTPLKCQCGTTYLIIGERNLKRLRVSSAQETPARGYKAGFGLLARWVKAGNLVLYLRSCRQMVTFRVHLVLIPYGGRLDLLRFLAARTLICPCLPPHFFRSRHAVIVSRTPFSLYMLIRAN